MVPFESVENLRVAHSVADGTVRIFVEGFPVESAKMVDQVHLGRDGWSFFLTVKSRLVIPLDHPQAEKFSEQIGLRKKWGSDPQVRVSLAKEFVFKNLPKGSYQVYYDSARDGSKKEIYRFHLE